VNNFIRFLPFVKFQEYLGSEFADFTGDLIEDFQSELFTNAWSHSNIEELNKSLEMALGNTDRFDVESPDSGIDFDFDIDGCNALIGVNDPIFNNFNGDVSDVEVEVDPEEVISLELPVITSENDNIEESNNLTSMEEDDGENEENSPSNVPNNHPVEIHSYSILKIKKTQAMKSKRKTTFIKDRLTSSKRSPISLNNKKQKLYEMEPLNDPVAERNRLNALNAKKNRDRKKQQLQEADEEISRLREENDDLRAEGDRIKDDLAKAKRELDALRQELKLRGGENASFLGNTISPFLV